MIRAGLTERRLMPTSACGPFRASANLPARCRQVAARLVDARMGALAARVDEMPAWVQTLPASGRIDALVAELGNLVLMSRAWGDGTAPDPGLRRRRPRRASPAIRMPCAAGRSAHVEPPPSDFFPVSGRRSAAVVEGEIFGAELVFYPSAHPLRAQIVQRVEVARSDPPPAPHDPLEAYATALGQEPWVAEVPLILPEGRLAHAEDGAIWWRGHARALPVLASGVPEVALGLPLFRGTMVWDGHLGRMLDAETPLGRIGFHG